MLKLDCRTGIPTGKVYDTRENFHTGRLWDHGTMNLAYAKIDGDTAKVLCQFTACKDYLTDSLVYSEEGIEGSPYWTFQGPIETEHTVLAFVVFAHFRHNIKLFQAWEKRLGITPLEVLDTDHPHIVIIKADKWWMSTTIHLSLLMSWLRNLNSNKVTKLRDGKGDQYIYSIIREAMILPRALKKLVVTIKRNSPTQGAMHGWNGHYTQIKFGFQEKYNLTYSEQLKKICPRLFNQPKPKEA